MSMANAQANCKPQLNGHHRLSKEGRWRSFAKAPNLSQYMPNGNYYARTKAHGKLIRHCLDTDVSLTEKLRRLDFLKTLKQRGDQPSAAPSLRAAAHDGIGPLQTALASAMGGLMRCAWIIHWVGGLLGAVAVVLHGQALRINEVMADDVGVLADEDGEYAGWVEVLNRGGEAVSLDGYGLSNDPAQPFQWTFPAITLEAGQRVVVFTSGKDRRPARPSDFPWANGQASQPPNLPGLCLWLDAADTNTLAAAPEAVGRWRDKSGRVVVPGVVEPLSPGGIPGLALWLDAADTNSLTLVDGAVAVWADKSGAGRAATQTVAALRPVLAGGTGGEPTRLRFDGVNDHLSFPRLEGGQTVITVAVEDAKATDSFRTLLGDTFAYDLHRGEKRYLLSLMPKGSLFGHEIDAWLNSEQIDPQSTLVPVSLGVFALRNTVAVRTSLVGSDRLLAGRYWQGEAAEILIFERALEDAEIQGVTEYLRRKWQVAFRPTPSNYDAVQEGADWRPAAAQDPQTGLPAVRFDGSDDWLAIPRITNLVSVFVVARRTSREADGYPTLLGDRTGYDFHRGADGILYHYIHASAAVRNGESRIDNEPVQSLTVRWPAARCQIATVVAGTATVGYLGTDRRQINSFWRGDLHELLCYDQPLSETEVRQISEYLATKWRLPETHLHANFKLNSAGQWITLTTPQGVSVSAWPPAVIPRGLSYGVEESGESSIGWFERPTPGGANFGTAKTGLTGLPRLEPADAFFTNHLEVAAVLADPKDVLRYTVDGTEPQRPLEAPVDIAWFDDALPAGANPPTGAGEAWTWVTADPTPYSGTAAHASPRQDGPHQHYFQDATERLVVRSGDLLYVYVYLDPAHPPRSLMVQWHSQSWEHRAFWGGDAFELGVLGTPSRYRAGELPPAGEWVRLEVEASAVGLEEVEVDGMAFALQDGGAAWDATGRRTVLTDTSRLWSGPLVLATNAVVRVRAFRADAVPSATVTASYLADPPAGIPVISLAADPADLFSAQRGIYVLGTNASMFTPFAGANFWQDWERPVHVDFFETNGQPGFAMDAGVKIHGSWSRSAPQKSLSIHARRKYGAGSIHYPLFPNRPWDSFETLLLRNTGNDWSKCLFRDRLGQSLASELGLGTQAGRAALVYINGTYWGVYRMVEPMDRTYFEHHYGAAGAEPDVIFNDSEVGAGDQTDWIALRDFAYANPLDESLAYQRVAAKVDLTNFAWYQIAQIFGDNQDWPGHNMAQWRPRTPPGRWQWLPDDMDGIFDMGGTGPDRDTLGVALGRDANNTAYPPAPLLSPLMANQEFRRQFVNQFADALNTVYRTDHVLAVIDRFQQDLDPHIARHLARWQDANVYGWPLPADREAWLAEVEVLRRFARERPAIMRSLLVQRFGLAGTVRLALAADPATGGTVRVNTLTPATTAEPWVGVYFHGVPLDLEAVPAAGYEFAGWSAGGVSGAAVQLTLTNDLALTAVFRLADDPDSLSTRPEPFDLWGHTFAFQALAASAPAGTYPSNMLFQQCSLPDPALATEMDGEWKLPYNLTSRSRYRGLGELGVSMVNTSDLQDAAGAGYVGAVIVALRTRGVTDIDVSWMGGTVAPNNRVYGLRLQYRLGDRGQFRDVLDAEGRPVEYLRSTIVGDSQRLGPTRLAAETFGQPLVQLRWKYYFIPSGASGGRAELRLDDIVVAGRFEAPRLRGVEAVNGLWRWQVADGYGRAGYVQESTNLIDWYSVRPWKGSATGGGVFEGFIQPDSAVFYRLWFP